MKFVTGDQAYANVAGQPANIMLYGPPGTSKTTDAVAAFVKGNRCTAFYIGCEDGSLKPIVARGLPIPDHTETPVKTWNDMAATIGQLAQIRQRYTGVIIDTVSTFTMYMANASQASGSNWGAWNAIRDHLFNLREWVRMLGLHCVMIAHCIQPEVREGVFSAGGPLLSPKSMIENYYGLVDTVLRVDYLHSPGRAPLRVYHTGGPNWPAALSTILPPADRMAWRVKNRDGYGDAVVPADLGAYLRGRQPPYQF